MRRGPDPSHLPERGAALPGPQHGGLFWARPGQHLHSFRPPLALAFWVFPCGLYLFSKSRVIGQGRALPCLGAGIQPELYGMGFTTHLPAGRQQGRLQERPPNGAGTTAGSVAGRDRGLGCKWLIPPQGRVGPTGPLQDPDPLGSAQWPGPSVCSGRRRCALDQASALSLLVSSPCPWAGRHGLSAVTQCGEQRARSPWAPAMPPMPQRG